MFGEIACKTDDVTSWTVSLSGRMGTRDTTGVLLQSYCVQEVYIWIDASINYNIGLLEDIFVINVIFTRPLGYPVSMEAA